MLTLFSLLACGPRVPPAPPAARPAEPCRILAINDTYRVEPLADGTGGMARVRGLRARLEEAGGDVLVLHAGDFLYPSLMSRIYRGEQMVEAMNALDGDAAAEDPRMFVVFGNHEFDESKVEELGKRVAASQFTWLGANLTMPAVADPHLASERVVACGGLRVGVFGVVTDKKTQPYVTFGDPVAAARDATARLRAAGTDVVVGVTHLTLEQDKALLANLGDAGPDLVVGGHEHDWKHEVVGGRPVYKADADAKTAWVLSLRPGGVASAERVALDGAVPEDPAVKTLVDARVARHEQDFCAKKNEAAGCLAKQVGTSTVPLVAAELDIRRFETNFGSWIADQALTAFPDAQIALVNSGSLRLNRDIAAGPVRRQDIEEMFAYPMPLARVELTRSQLDEVLERAVFDWTGNGHWLQVAGLAWVHDPAAGTATKPTLLSTGREIAAGDRIVAVVPKYLVDPSGDQDGYKGKLPEPTAEGADLKQLVLDALAKGPISPAKQGRICNTTVAGPCLAVE